MLTDDIETSRLVLTCLAEKHASEAYLSWLSEPEVNQFLETRFSAQTLGSLRQFVADVRASSHSYLFGIMMRDSGVHCGNIKVGPISAAHGSASIGLVIGDRDSWGKGIATEAIDAVSTWAFDSLGLDKLTAGAYRANSGSVRAFQKCGFDIEGVQRNQVRLNGGARDDVVLLGRMRSDGPATRGRA